MISDPDRTRIRDEALSLGFDVCGFASAADAWPAGARLEAFVAEGLHGTMGWMAQTLPRRAHPPGMWPDATRPSCWGPTMAPILIR